MDTLIERVVNDLLGWGADLVGIAPLERFANAPEGQAIHLFSSLQSDEINRVERIP